MSYPYVEKEGLDKKFVESMQKINMSRQIAEIKERNQRRRNEVKAKGLLEKSAEGIENLYGKETELTKEIRKFLNR